MTHVMLRPDDPWRERSDRPDIRGWRVEDADGRLLGRVETVIADTEQDTVVAVLLGPNERYEAADIAVGDGVVRLARRVEPAATPSADGLHTAPGGDSEVPADPEDVGSYQKVDAPGGRVRGGRERGF